MSEQSDTTRTTKSRQRDAAVRALGDTLACYVNMATTPVGDVPAHVWRAAVEEALAAAGEAAQ